MGFEEMQAARKCSEMMDGKGSVTVFDFKPNTPQRRLPAFVDEFNKSYGVKIVFFTIGYSTLRC